MALMGTHGDAVIDAVAVAIRKPRAWVEGLELPDLTSLALAAMEVNKDFFTRQVQPAMERLDSGMRRMGLPGVGLPSSLGSSQASSQS